jgi:Tfp pilus assembly protein PilV
MTNNPRLAKDKGFTLIEVMISAIILFAALAVSAELFKVSSFSAEKAAKSARFYQINPAAMAAIRLSLKESAFSDKGKNFSGNTLLFGVEYQWQANLISLLPPPVYQGDLSVGAPTFGLYNVDVIATQTNKEQQFSFQVATW